MLFIYSMSKAKTEKKKRFWIFDFQESISQDEK